MAQPDFGATAWGRAWLRTVEPLSGVPHPGLPKARALARNQKATLTVEAGRIDAEVIDGAASHRVEVSITRWNGAEEASADDVLAAENAVSVAGDLADGLVGRLAKRGVRVAVALEDLRVSCTCRSRSRPCPHVLAVIYGLILLIDERPLTALELRTSSSPAGGSADSPWVPLSAIDPEHFYTRAITSR